MGVSGLILAMALTAAPLSELPSERLANRYLVEFETAPAATFKGIADKSGAWILAPTDPAWQGHRRLRADAPEVRAYRAYLALRRAEVLSAIEARLAAKMRPRFVYELATHGVSLELTAEQARQIENLAGIKRVTAVGVHRLASDAGPAWIGADQAWASSGAMGEGVVVGVLDSGVNFDHPAFAEIGGDGFRHSNPRGIRFGLCSNPQVSCNDKLIGVYEFTSEGQMLGRDVAGHGSHVASIAVGNIRPADINAITTALSVDVAGVAPHANLISYKVCQDDDDNTQEDEGFCPGDAILAALDQAVADGVDLINYSIGSATSNPWNDGIAQAMLNARNAGILIFVSAGNAGPGADSMSSPANAPWLVAAANITHNRQFTNVVEALTGGSAAAPPDLRGVGVTGAFGPTQIVHAKDFGNALCGAGNPELQPTCDAHTGSSNPFSAGTFDGQIVVCDRGTYGRVEKGFNLRAAGAGGYILANTADQGESIVSDDHCLSGVHLGRANGDLLRTWLDSGGGDHSGRISGQFQEINDVFGDLVASSSSRGPDRFVPGVMKPDLAAPGSNILAAGVQGLESAFLSGTSMASPAVAGAAALLLSASPGLTPAQLHSILITTARNDQMRDSDGVSPAGVFDVGAGRAWVADGVRAGLYMDVSGAQFAAANPNLGGNPGTLNLPAMINDACFESCSFSKTVTALVGDAQWSARFEGPAGIGGSVSPPSFTLAQGQSRTLQITVDVSDPRLLNTTVTGYLALESDDPSLAITRLPIQVRSSVGPLPQRFAIETAQNRGSAMLNLAGLVALPAAEYQTLGLARATQTTESLFGDNTPQEPFDDLNDEGLFFEFVSLDKDGGAVIASTIPEFNGDLDLFLGRDDNGDGLPAETELICSSTSPQSAETCAIHNARSGNYWVMVQNFRRSSSIGRDRSTVAAAAIEADSAGGLVATGPGETASGQSFPLRLIWEQGEMQAGERWLGAVIPKASRTPGVGALGAIAVELVRTAGDGANEALVLAPGEPASFTLAPEKAHERLFIDVPQAATGLTLTTTTSAGADLEVLLVRQDAVFSPPDVPAVQSVAAPALQQSISAGGDMAVSTLSGGALTAGRYYIVPTNNDSGNEVTLEVLVELEAGGNSVTPVQGLWFNPARDGAGFNLNLSGDQLIIEWYTYLEDGTPVWYLAQAAFPPDGDVWTADLFFFNWDGLSAAPTRVGKVVLTFLTPSDMIFSFQVNGRSGSEPYTAIVPDLSCETQGAALEQTGLWFIPATPGFGYSILSLAGQQVHINYLYDGFGFPRWVLGQGIDGDADLTMSQYSGFCPSCAVTPVTSVAVGSNTIGYDDRQSGQIESLVAFTGALSGNWNEAGAIANLTPTLSCD